jgi:GxxExxY protein
MHKKIHMITQKHLDNLTYSIIGAAIEVHKIMGRGLLESVYHQCLKEELTLRNINFISEMKIPIIYKQKELESDFRCDLYVESAIVVELKSTLNSHPIFEAKLLNYMNLIGSPKGILINFNCNNIFKEGQKTFVNDYYKKLPKE